MKKETVFIAINNQKGGVGKTTDTILLASYFQYRMGLRILLADCDLPQWSINCQRDRELALVQKDKEVQTMFLKQFDRTSQKAYPILRTQPEKAIKDVLEFIANDEREFDLALFDLPGTLNTNGVFYTISMLDYVFVPIKADRMIVETSIMYAKIIQEQLIGQDHSNLKGICLFWSMVDKRERTQLYDQYAKILATLGLSVMHTRIPARSKFSREPIGSGPMYRSTLFAPDSAFARESHLDELAQEIISTLKLDESCHEK